MLRARRGRDGRRRPRDRSAGRAAGRARRRGDARHRITLTQRRERTKTMTTKTLAVGALAASLAFTASSVCRTTPQTAPGDTLDPRTYDPGSRLFLVVHAVGVQKYTCQADGTWLFTDPEATLFATNGAAKPKSIGTHFLNFASGRPVWEFKDGSSVEAARFSRLGRHREHRVAPPPGRRETPPGASAARRGCSGSIPPAESLRRERARPAPAAPSPTPRITSSGEHRRTSLPGTSDLDEELRSPPSSCTARGRFRRSLRG